MLGEAEPLLRGCVWMYRASGDRYLLGCALTQLGRVLAREGRFEESLAALDEGKGDLEEIGATAEALEADVATVECLTFQGDSHGAITRAVDALEGIKAVGGQSVAVPLLHRAWGYALAQEARFDEADAAFAKSLEAAKERGSDFDMAVTKIAMERVARVRGLSVPEGSQDEIDATLVRLEVVAVEATPISLT